MQQRQEVALVVRGAARVEAPVALGGLERRAVPGVERPRVLHVVVAVGQHGGGVRRGSRAARRWPSGGRRRSSPARPRRRPPRCARRPTPPRASAPRRRPRRWTRRGCGGTRSSSSRIVGTREIVPHAQRVALSPMRRLFPLVAAVVLVDTMFFAAVAPLLPHYSDELGLSKSAAGRPGGGLSGRHARGLAPRGLAGSAGRRQADGAAGPRSARRDQRGLRLRPERGRARHCALRPGHRRRLLLGGRARVARDGLAGGPPRHRDRLGAGRRDRGRAARPRARRARQRSSAPSSCSAAWRVVAVRPGRVGLDRARHPAGAERGHARRRPRAAAAGGAPGASGCSRCRRSSPAAIEVLGPLRLDELGASGALDRR